MPNYFMLAAGHAGRHSIICMLKILMRKIRDGRQDDAFSRAPGLPFQI